MTGLLDDDRDQLPDFLDFIVINGDPCPGKCTVQKPNSPRGWDERQGYGMSGATLAPKGDPLAKFSVLVEIWSGTDYLIWKEFCAKHFTKNVVKGGGLGSPPRALGIYHPELAAPPISISEVVVEDIISNGQDEDGLWSWEIKFIQYRAPVKITQKPTGAVPAASNDAPTATTAIQRENVQLAQTLNGLAK